jgi:hypothetical protein
VFLIWSPERYLVRSSSSDARIKMSSNIQDMQCVFLLRHDNIVPLSFWYSCTEMVADHTISW